MKVFWRMAQRYYEARHRRALKQGRHDKAHCFQSKAEKFFRRINHGRSRRADRGRS